MDWILLKSPGVEPCCTTPSTFRVNCWVFCTGMASLGVRGEGDKASWNERSHTSVSTIASINPDDKKKYKMYLYACWLKLLEEISLERQWHLEQGYDSITETTCVLWKKRIKPLPEATDFFFSVQTATLNSKQGLLSALSWSHQEGDRRVLLGETLHLLQHLAEDWHHASLIFTVCLHRPQGAILLKAGLKREIIR